MLLWCMVFEYVRFRFLGLYIIKEVVLILKYKKKINKTCGYSYVIKFSLKYSKVKETYEGNLIRLDV